MPGDFMWSVVPLNLRTPPAEYPEFGIGLCWHPFHDNNATHRRRGERVVVAGAGLPQARSQAASRWRCFP